jgi:ATP-dependent RNA helicase DeaD
MPKPSRNPNDTPKKSFKKKSKAAPKTWVAKDKTNKSSKPGKAKTPYIKADRAESKPFVEVPFEPPTFAELGLDDTIIRAITELGYESPTPIQARAIPVLLQGGDLIGQAQTGTGKTAAFALPIIQKIDPSRSETQALILAPTRELAVQVAGGIWDLAKHTGLKVVPVYGGQPIDRQFRSLKNGAHIVVGTPGRVLDHLRRGSLSLDKVTHCTLDEADEMMALGFAEDMEAILAQLPSERQIACFSATMPARILDLTKKFLRNPKHLSIETKQRTLETTNQTYYEVPKGQKLEALARVLDMESPGPTIVFCRTRQETSDLSDALRLRGYNAEALHGDMNQGERDRVMRRFRDGQADLLIATDVAARGLDIETVTHVINYDIPWDVEQYIHRIGRTGRAGRTGDAITLVEGRQRRQLEAIERMIGSKIKPARIPTAADIASRRRDEFKEALRETLEARQFDGHLGTVEDLQGDFDPAEIAAAALHMLWQSKHSGESAPEEVDADFEQPEIGMARIFVGMGRQDGLRPGDLVGAIAGEAGLPGKMIGVIDILDRSAFVEVPAADAARVVEALSMTKLRNKKVKVQLARAASEEQPYVPPMKKGKRRE